MIGFRADANSEIGYGHVMRLISIATECINCNEDVVFYISGEESEKLITENQLPFRRVEADETNFEADILVVDSYSVTKDYFNNIKNNHPNIKIVYVDDLLEDVYPVDMIINSNVYANDMCYADKYPDLEEKGNLLLGSIYAPLRNQFITATKREFSPECDNVLLTVGGGDQLGMLVRLTEKIIENKAFKNIDFHVVVGGLPLNQDRLVELSKDTRNVFIHKNVSNMASLMKNCDLAISAAGTTLLELASLGIPTICFTVAKNQKYDGEYYARHKQMEFVGDAITDIDGVCDKVVLKLEELTNDRKSRKELSKKSESITDGKGALRLAKAIIALK